jgi:hypothetical protein
MDAESGASIARIIAKRYVGMNEAACGGRRFAFDELAPTAW